MKDHILRLRTAERKISEAMTATMDSPARVKLLEACAAIINVRMALMKLEPTP